MWLGIRQLVPRPYIRSAEEIELSFDLESANYITSSLLDIFPHKFKSCLLVSQKKKKNRLLEEVLSRVNIYLSALLDRDVLVLTRSK